MSDTVELLWLNEQLILMRATLWALVKPEQSFTTILEEYRAQADLFRAANAPATATHVQQSRCDGVPEEKCGLLDADARISRGSFTNPNAWQCAGCGHQETGKYASQ